MNSAIIPRSIARTMTGIEWTDFTGNPWIGCTNILPNRGGRSGCEVCYAEKFARHRLDVPWNERTPFIHFRQRMRRLNRLAETTGLAFSVFSLSLGDWLDKEVPPDLRNELIEAVEECRYLTWLLLTHRPHLASKLAPASWRSAPPANVWPGVTIDHAAHAYRWDAHADFWAHTGRAWISAEPLTSSLDGCVFQGMAVMIMGGASGAPDSSWEFRPEWTQEAVDRYGEDRVFLKQYGDWRDGARVGKKAAGRDLAGRVYDRTPWPRHRELLRSAAA